MSQVNLLPPELKERHRVRRFTSMVVVAGVGLLAVVGLFYVLQVMNLGRVEDELKGQQLENSGLQAKIDALQPFADLQVALEEKRDLVDIVLANEVSWAGVLTDVSRLIPDDAYLTDLTGALSVTTGTEQEPETEADTGLIGSMTFNGYAAEVETIAVWLTSLDERKGWENSWVASAQLSEADSGIGVYQFSGSVDLSRDVVTRRGSRGGAA